MCFHSFTGPSQIGEFFIVCSVNMIVYYWFSVICDCYYFLAVLEWHWWRKCCYQWRTVSGSCVKKDQAPTSFLSMLSAVHHLWEVPVLKVCVMSVFTSSKTGRGTNRALVYLVCQAEFISFTVERWVRTGVLAFVGSVLLFGRGFTCVWAGC
jgi:hypothetical protein